MTNITASRIWIATIITSTALLAGPVIEAQETTEQFVPIEQSPGVSNRVSYIGNIVSVNAAAHTITVESNRGTKTMKILTTTRIWLDRSSGKRTNITASYSDCKVGRKVEVMYDRDDHDVAEWIKIEGT